MVLAAILPFVMSAALQAQAIARSMVAAYRAYRPPEPYVALTTTVSNDQKVRIDSVVAAAKAVSGQSPAGQEMMNFLMAARAWYVQHGMSPNASAINYAARIRSLDAVILDDWSAAAAKLAVGPTDRILLVLAIAFNDPLWSGNRWAPGNPTAVLARLRSLPAETVAAWTDATGAKEVPFIAAYSLLGLDQLFDSNVFQAARFQAALPAARGILASN
jgi:hypothetical protein